ncbi:MAG: glutamate synthase subunit beta [Lentisphaeria bacterium]|nr:glutamate synthase subunit beta [Lentisphaeria bacterium]
MSKTFIDIPRLEHVYRPIDERVNDCSEVEMTLPKDEIRQLAKRCQNCGLPFCHAMGCPLQNAVPDMNRAVMHGNWRDAWERLAETSPFPEFTSRICPALCEASCCLEGEGFGATNVRQIEKKVVDTAFANGWVHALKPLKRNGRRVAVIGAGPAGMAAAVKLNKAGFEVVIYDRHEKIGGLLRYGIPCFKLDKALIDRRWALMAESGISFYGKTEIGQDISGSYLLKHFDAVVVANGTPVPRDLKVPGRELVGIVQALELLGSQNRMNTGEINATSISGKGKDVLIIGGGDTGNDCAGTVIRQGANSVMSIDLMPKPPVERDIHTPWPMWPYKLRGSSSVDEGLQRFWALNTLRFIGDENGQVTGVEVVPVKWEFAPNGKPMKFTVAGPSRTISCGLVVLAMGFLKRSREDVLASLGLPDQKNVLIAGDAASGPSLVVRAIADGLKCAKQLI